MEENQTIETQKPPSKKDNKPGWFVLLIGFFLILRGGMRLAEGEIAVMGILMLIIGLAGVIYYFAKR